MKCPICSSANPSNSKTCHECGTSLQRPPDPASRNPNANTTDLQKEVSEKVRAYGERRKRLTTPPGALREQQDKAWEEPEHPRVLRPFRVSAATDSAVHDTPGHAFPAEAAVVPPAIEIWKEDLEDSGSPTPDTDRLPLYLGRRTLALAIDSITVIVIVGAAALLFSWIRAVPFRSVFISEWRILIPLSLLIHFAYYAYFLKSARQTPGMVFVALELRNPSSSDIPVFKIVVRWLCFLLLNVLNLVPLLAGQSAPLMDLVSGTRIRSLK